MGSGSIAPYVHGFSTNCGILKSVNKLCLAWLKVKLSMCLSKHCALKTHGSGCIDSHFLDLGTNWR
jgi:hypothetical protein